MIPGCLTRPSYSKCSRLTFPKLAGFRNLFLEAVTDEFYKEFKNHFDALPLPCKEQVIRLSSRILPCCLLCASYFWALCKRRMAGTITNFCWSSGKSTGNPAALTLFIEWLEPLFFEALSSPPGRKVAFGYALFFEKRKKRSRCRPTLTASCSSARRMWMIKGFDLMNHRQFL